MAKQLFDLFHALADKFAAHNCLNVYDGVQNHTCVTIGFLGELGQDMALLLWMLTAEAIRGQIVAILMHGRVSNFICLLADSTTAARN